jgi:hypothetical protein
VTVRESEIGSRSSTVAAGTVHEQSLAAAPLCLACRFPRRSAPARAKKGPRFAPWQREGGRELLRPRQHESAPTWAGLNGATGLATKGATIRSLPVAGRAIGPGERTSRADCSRGRAPRSRFANSPAIGARRGAAATRRRRRSPAPVRFVSLAGATADRWRPPVTGARVQPGAPPRSGRPPPR